MSVVGPRPERRCSSSRFKSPIALYNTKRAVGGITGLAQVNGGRGSSDFHERINYDIEYVERSGLWLDLKIILMTLPAMLRRTNAY